MKIVQETLIQFTDDLRLILNENLFEIIIYGSYVLDDFRSNFGDLDFLVLTNVNWNDKANESLLSLHEKYRSEKQLLLHQLEGTYYPKSFMRNPENVIFGLYIGTSIMKPITYRKTSYVDLRLIKVKGLMLLGSNCSTYDPSEADLQKEQNADIQGFRNTIENDSQVDFGFWISLIHWCARTLFYRANSYIGSKTVACQWCSNQSALSDFQELFKTAEALRYPYQEKTIQDNTKMACIKLLEMIDT
jgi:hypothetical protein